jgi:hypothetical protein
LRHAVADVDAPVLTSRRRSSDRNPTGTIIDKYLIPLKSVGAQGVYLL